ncbi:MAG: lamin tail domain-containing protein [Phycisphaerales bacterium]
MLKVIFVATITIWSLCAVAHADCPLGDLNRDCRVDGTDLVLFARTWLTDSNSPADLDGSGSVDYQDLALLSSQWQQTGCPIVINEVLAHAHAEASDWVELYNVSNVPVDIGGWTLSDKENELDRYRIPANTIVDPCGYVVLYETIHFGNPLDPGAKDPFAFSENGDVAFLYSGDDPRFPGFLVSEPFGASETNYSFGRHLKSTGTYNFVTMSMLTPGRANAYPLVGPVVVNEIMYHPATDADAEYIELLNISGGSVTFFDYESREPWRLVDDSGIAFSFPTAVPVTIGPGGHVLLVRDLAAVQRCYGVPAGVPVFSWGTGKLSNQGEKLQLFKPGDVDDLGIRYWIEVDRVAYSDGSHGEGFPGGVDPWPAGADGDGPSLNRLFPSRYGNDPNDWHATLPTPGAVND